MNNQELHVIFGTGPLGRAVMRELVIQGKRVRMVNHSGKAHDIAAESVEVVQGDATNPANVRQLCQGASVVYHCAQPGYTRWPEQFPPITNGILEGLRNSDTKLVFGDNLYMYGPVSGSITEDLPYRATGRKGRVRAQMAETLLEAHYSGNVRVTIGRGSDFYGPFVLDSTLGDIVFGASLTGKAVQLVGNPDLLHTYTFIDDFGRALVTLGQHDDALGQVWHVPNAPAMTTRQMVELVSKEIGKPVKTIIASRFMLQVAGIFSPTLRELPEMMYEFEQPYIVDSSKYERTFGGSATPHEAAIQQTLAWYRQSFAEKMSKV